MESEGLEIVNVDQNFLRDFRSYPLELMQTGLSVQALLGNGWQGFISGGGLCFHEDDLDFMAPSALLLTPAQVTDFGSKFGLAPPGSINLLTSLRAKRSNPLP